MGSAPRNGRPAHIRLDPPERLTRTIGAWAGQAGRDWLARLPAVVADCLERWELTPERVFGADGTDGTVSMIVLVTTVDGDPAVLKVGMVNRETAQEHAALARWNGHGAVRLLRADPERGAMVLERLRPDVSARSLAEPRALLTAAEVLRRLWVPPGSDHPFTTVAEYTAELAPLLRERGEQPWAADARPLIDKALAVREALLADGPEPVLLHGDYHQGNVLAGGREPWLAIDPKPLVGEPAYDAAWLARDRLDTLLARPSPRDAARRRLSLLSSALVVDPGRLRGWSLFRAVEAGVWSLAVGDQEVGEQLLEFADWL
ncbi:aminoglycoside phosphotransferase family protein [Streptomyces sp. NBC_01190]|uniref:aminoglycoside phosphotransferase family protein n=1 Tax=Streptomyces sp. NBC_01190 TaxID=2903767 RepID=UPI00386716BD|nr:aminoglycoside phosphotransferase family protein [Streptomyces sp. NBC_01190]